MNNFNGKSHLIIRLLMMLILIFGFGIIFNSRAGDLVEQNWTSHFDIFRDIVSVPNVDANEFGVPITGPGSPWEPYQLSLPNGSVAAFFCLYEFSSPRAKHIFDYVLNNTEYPCGPDLGKCNCVCIYNGNCNK